VPCSFGVLDLRDEVGVVLSLLVVWDGLVEPVPWVVVLGSTSTGVASVRS
jgi:hypothetical protein